MLKSHRSSQSALISLTVAVSISWCASATAGPPDCNNDGIPDDQNIGPQPDIIYSDGDFSSGWSYSLSADSVPSASIDSITNPGTGGDPDSYQRVTHSWTGPGSIRVRGIYTAVGVYDPASLGEITSVDFSFSAQAFSAVGTNAVSFSPVIRQGGVFVQPNVADLANEGTGWTSMTFNGLTAADNFGGLIDFSITAPPIEFGFNAQNSTGGAQSLSSTWGIDNLQVVIHRADGPDCNLNGIPDTCELVGNDCNGNLIPDDCEADCNGNGIPDDCDIINATSTDTNMDGIPDECQGIIYVDDDASPGGNGQSWNTAFRFLQDGLALAAVGSEIRVAGGTYVPDQSEANPAGTGLLTDTFSLASDLTLKGGYRGLAGGGSPDDRDPNSFRANLSGALAANNSYHVVTASGVNATAVLDGFVIRDGDADNAPDDDGGGILINSGGSPTINDCDFQNNSAVFFGAAAYVEGGGSPTFTACRFEDNAAGVQSGAIRIEQSDVTVDDCFFARNTATQEGGAITFGDTSTGSISASTFVDNSTVDEGGAIALSQSVVSISGCSFVENNADVGGGAILIANVSDAAVASCDFAENTGLSGGAIRLRNTSTAGILRCNFTSNQSNGPGNDSGGAIFAVDSDPLTIMNSVFAGNSAEDNGGAIFADATRISMANCLLVGNTCVASAAASAIGMREQAAALTTLDLGNSTFADNRAGSATGTTLLLSGTGSPSANILNAVFWGNTALGGSVVDQQINVLSGTATVTHCDVQDDDPADASIPFPGNGNIDDDPLFVGELIGDPNAAWTAGSYDPNTGQTTLTDSTAGFTPGAFAGLLLNPDTSQFRQGLIVANTATEILVWGNFEASGSGGAAYQVRNHRLTPASPSRDAGFNAGLRPDTLDLDNDPNTLIITLDLDDNPRIDFGVVDMGAYEIQAPPIPAILHVDASAPGGGFGTSWADAIQHLQQALGIADGSGGVVTEIRIAQGTYMPDGARIPVGGALVPGTADTALVFSLIDGVTIRGGYRGAYDGSGLSADDRDLDTLDPNFATILSGDLLGDDAPGFVGYADNSNRVLEAISIPSPLLIEGLTIRGADASGGIPFDQGAGFRIQGGALTAQHCRFLENRTTNDGGGAAITGGATTTFDSCLFRDNVASDAGGGIFGSASNLTIHDSIFDDNTATSSGGAVWMSQFLDVSGTSFLNNTSGTGGAIDTTNVNDLVTINDCDFVDNAANSGGGGAVNFRDGVIATLTASRFVGNSSTGSGGAVRALNSDLRSSDCVYVQNTATNFGGGVGASGTGGFYLLFNNVFTNNDAGSAGGGLWIDGVSTIANAVFAGNTADSGGGVLVGSAALNTTLAQNTLTDNGARNPAGGGGIEINVSAAPALIRNSILWGNLEDIDGTPGSDVAGQILDPVGSDVRFCVIQDNDPNDSVRAYPSLPIILDDDPRFQIVASGTFSAVSNDPITGVDFDRRGCELRSR